MIKKVILIASLIVMILSHLSGHEILPNKIIDCELPKSINKEIIYLFEQYRIIGIEIDLLLKLPPKGINSKKIRDKQYKILNNIINNLSDEEIKTLVSLDWKAKLEIQKYYSEFLATSLFVNLNGWNALTKKYDINYSDDFISYFAFVNEIRYALQKEYTNRFGAINSFNRRTQSIILKGEVIEIDNNLTKQAKYTNYARKIKVKKADGEYVTIKYICSKNSKGIDLRINESYYFDTFSANYQIVPYYNDSDWRAYDLFCSKFRTLEINDGVVKGGLSSDFDKIFLNNRRYTNFGIYIEVPENVFAEKINKLYNVLKEVNNEK